MSYNKPTIEYHAKDYQDKKYKSLFKIYIKDTKDILLNIHKYVSKQFSNEVFRYSFLIGLFVPILIILMYKGL